MMKLLILQSQHCCLSAYLKIVYVVAYDVITITIIAKFLT